MCSPSEDDVRELLTELKMYCPDSINHGVPEKIVPGHSIHNLVKEIEAVYPDGKLPVEGCEIWHELLRSSRAEDDLAYRYAFHFRRWIDERYCGDLLVKPNWDPDLRELTYEGKMCKKYRQDAPNQIPILEAFVKKSWRPRIAVPRIWENDVSLVQKVADALRGLNENDHIRFEKDGTTKGILWRPADLET